MNFQDILIVLLVFCLSFAVSQDELLPQEDPALFYNMVELVCSEGYHVQEHLVTTEDGYIIRVYRIPGGKRRPKVKKTHYHYQYVHHTYHPDFHDCFLESQNISFRGPAILMSHGLEAASDCWVLQGDQQDLAFMLAEKGYDIWLTNTRGNFYSKRHVTLKPSDRQFWDFSFHENGIYDIPGVIDYILNFTGLKKLQYVGHSMGTTMFFVMASVRPEYNDKVSLFVALTPVGHIRMGSYSRMAQALLNFLIFLIRAYAKLGVFQILPRNNLSNYIARLACTAGSPVWMQNLCYDASFFFAGRHSKLMTREKLPVYLTHGFSGSSIKTFEHYAQNLKSKDFQYYDYGPEENFRRYGQEKPLIYNVSKVTVPSAFYYSRQDYISDPKDVDNLKGLIPNLVFVHEYNLLNHVDFIWAHNAKRNLFLDVIEMIEQFKTEPP